MIQVQKFTFSPFAENTYVLFDETKECIIIDPGCYDERERNALAAFISNNSLTPALLVNTHCHLDHIFGNKFVKEQYNIPLHLHHADLPLLENAVDHARVYGLEMEASPAPDKLIDENDKLTWGNSSMDIVFTPGHSPGSISFIARDEKFVIGGDVLFQQSIGRTDLPGGDFDTLANSIRTELYTLPDDFIVYSGHGPETSIGYEKIYNGFVRA